MDDALQLGFFNVLASYIFVLIFIFVVRLKGIKREKEIILSSIRMTIQLVLAGYVLQFIINNSRWYFTVITVLGMLTFAIFNIFKRVKVPVSNQLKKIIAIAMTFGTLSSLLYFALVVMNLQPWYETRYIVPISGMIIGNSMTGISLGVSELIKGMTIQNDMVETALMLGATPKEATKNIINHALDTAFLPMINSMMGMGIVFLPGMMTGQILAGASPVDAIMYQIAIMFGILGSVFITVIIFVQLGYRTFFNKENQIIEK